MKSRLLVATILNVGLLSGCVAQTGDFCDVARPIYIGSENVVDWLAENDENLLRSVVSHNEKTATCR